MNPGRLHRSRDGHMLCEAHRTSGCQTYHVEGCEACAAAKAKGIVRPDITTVPPKQRGRKARNERGVDWNRVRMVRSRS